jgi:DNA-binding response OmpR family regulator
MEEADPVGNPLVLVVDDDPQLRALLRMALELDQFVVEEAASGAEALEFIVTREPDLVLLNVLMPGLNGIETCRWIRAQSGVQIIMLSGLSYETDIVAALEAGANDYCVKPIGMVELVARIRAQLRRRDFDTGDHAAHRTLGRGDLVLDLDTRQVRVRGRLIRLSRREFDLLECLAQSPGRIVRHEELLRVVFGSGDPANLPHLRGYIMRLREKIEPEPHRPRYIRLRARLGYLLEWE